MYFFFFKQKTAYEMRISDWSSDVCSSDLVAAAQHQQPGIASRVAPEERLERADCEIDTLVGTEMAHGAEQQRSLIRPRHAPGPLAHGGIGPEPIQIDAQRAARHLACAAIVVVGVVLPPLLRSSPHPRPGQAPTTIAPPTHQAPPPHA